MRKITFSSDFLKITLFIVIIELKNKSINASTLLEPSVISHKYQVIFLTAELNNEMYCIFVV